MTYKCKQDMRLTPFTFSLLLVASTLCLCEAAKREGKALIILIALSAVFIVLALALASRYMFYLYIYVLSADGIKVYRIRGTSSTLLANVTLYECLALVKSKADFGASADSFKGYNYVQNLFPKNARYLYFESAGEKGVMRLEASDEFYSMLLNLMPSKEV